MDSAETEEVDLDALSDDALVRFLQNLESKDVQGFYDTNVRMKKLCQKDEVLMRSLLGAFTVEMIEKYSPLVSYLRTDVYKNIIESELAHLICILERYGIQYSQRLLDGDISVHFPTKWARFYTYLWQLLMGLNNGDFLRFFVELDEDEEINTYGLFYWERISKLKNWKWKSLEKEIVWWYVDHHNE